MRLGRCKNGVLKTMNGALFMDGRGALSARLLLGLVCLLAQPLSLLAQEAYRCNGSDYYGVRWVHSTLSPSPNKPVEEGKEKFEIELTLAINPDGKTGTVQHEKTSWNPQPAAPIQARISRSEYGFGITWTTENLPSLWAASIFPPLQDSKGVIFGTAVSLSATMGNYAGTVRQLKCRRAR